MSTDSDTVVKAFEREDFYRDKQGHLRLISFLLIVLAVSFGGVIFLLRSLSVPAPLYFSAEATKALVAEAPLDKPSIQKNELLNWVAEGMMKAYTLNFINYQANIDKASVYFTREGFATYQAAFVNTKILERLLADKLVLKAVPTDAPNIIVDEPFAGRYMWKIKLPMRFQYESVTRLFSEMVEVTLIVMRVPTSQSPNGVSILKINLDVVGRE